jgi:hypothetical protein
MTSPPREISIICPACGYAYKTWLRASINLSLESFSAEYIKEVTSGRCPKCSEIAELDVLIVDEEGTFRSP